jgi:phage recombination protein Bet
MSETQATEQKQQVSIFQPARLPYHKVMEERFGVDKMGWKTLTEAIFPSAQSVDSIAMALAYCKARNLDIFKRPVHIVPVWDSNQKKMVETVWPGISELRTTAFRTHNYAGCDETVFGPDIKDNLGGVEITYPEWAQCTIYRMLNGTRIPIVGPKVYWIESYATISRSTMAPNSMWQKRPRGQLEKCCEAAGLRKAFPEELGNEYSAEEMEGQSYQAIRDVTPQSSGLKERLEARRSAKEGFLAVNGSKAPEEPEEGLHASEIEPEDEIPHDPETGKIEEGVEQLNDEVITRLKAWNDEVSMAKTTIRLKALWGKAGDLRKALEPYPETTATFERAYNERYYVVLAEEKAKRAAEIPAET